MSESLRQIALNSANASAELEEMLISTDGEITDQIAEFLAVKDIQLPAKVDSYAYLMERMDVLAMHYKCKAEYFQNLAKAADKVTDRCKSNLEEAMNLIGTQEILGFDTKFKFVKTNPSVVINDESLIPEEFKIPIFDTQIDKKAISARLKDGIEVSGCSLKQGQTLKKLANTPGKAKQVKS